MRIRPLPTKEELEKILSYDPDSGIFTWLVSFERAKAGDEAGYIITRDGYRCIKIKGINYRAHRLAFILMGVELLEVVDHKNGIRSDNRWCNLRPATYRQNSFNQVAKVNSKTGLKGAYFHKLTGKYCAGIRVGGKIEHLGSFDTAEEAHAAYCRASIEYYREYSFTEREEK